VLGPGVRTDHRMQWQLATHRREPKKSSTMLDVRWSLVLVGCGRVQAVSTVGRDTVIIINLTRNDRSCHTCTVPILVLWRMRDKRALVEQCNDWIIYKRIIDDRWPVDAWQPRGDKRNPEPEHTYSEIRKKKATKKATKGGCETKRVTFMLQ
jgi:hypothetical protein